METPSIKDPVWGRLEKKLEALEELMYACAHQERQLTVVDTKLESATNTLKTYVFTEEERILNITIEAAKTTVLRATSCFSVDTINTRIK